MNRLKSFALPALVLLAACGSAQPSEPPPLAGAAIGGPFTLVSETGETVTDAAFNGRHRLIYFGFTFCPDVCPVDLARLMAGYRALESRDPALAGRLQPLFITVDPARDTPAVVRTFTDAFHPRLIGLTGSDAAIAEVADRHAVYFNRVGAAGNRDYLVDHSRTAYLMGPAGEPLAIIPHYGTPDAIADELERWMR